MPDPPLHPAIQRVSDAAARKGVTLDIRTFDASTHTAQDAAEQVGAELGQIVKSLVFVAPGDDGPEPILCLVSGPNRVDLARLSAVVGVHDIRRASAREANELTGFVIGGIPPIGHPGPIRVVMDPDLGRFAVVWAAAGTPTAVFPVPPATLRMLSNATVAPIAEMPDVRQSAAPGQSAAGADPAADGADRAPHAAASAADPAADATSNPAADGADRAPHAAASAADPAADATRPGSGA